MEDKYLRADLTAILVKFNIANGVPAAEQDDMEDPQPHIGRIPISNIQVEKQRLHTAHSTPTTRKRVQRLDPSHKPRTRLRVKQPVQDTNASQADGSSRQRRGKGLLDALIAFGLHRLREQAKRGEDGRVLRQLQLGNVGGNNSQKEHPLGLEYHPLKLFG